MLIKAFAQRLTIASVNGELSGINRLAGYSKPTEVSSNINRIRACFHTDHSLWGRHDVAQHKRILANSKRYDDKWSTDLDAWSDKNKMLFPPLDPGEGIRPAEVYHGRRDIRYSAKRIYQVSRLIRNMDIDEALTRLSRIESKGAEVVKEVLLEAQELAVKDHNVEYKSNLHIVASFATSEGHIPFPIWHKMGSASKGRMRFINYYVLLREGPAPAPTPQKTALDAAEEYLHSMRNRYIIDGL